MHIVQYLGSHPKHLIHKYQVFYIRISTARCIKRTYVCMLALTAKTFFTASLSVNSLCHLFHH